MTSPENNLAVMKFKNRKVYDKNVLYGACPEAEALFRLMSPRQYLNPNELVHIANMGFKWEIIGDIREFKEEMNRINPN